MTDVAACEGVEPGSLVLEVVDVKTYFDTDEGTVRAVDGVSFTVHAGEVLAIVGESGSGKTISALSILGLVPGSGRVQEGSIRLNGRELVGASPGEMQSIRGSDIAMIFQDPLTALNPVYTVGDQIIETVRVHQPMAWSPRAFALKLFGRVMGLLAAALFVIFILASAVGDSEAVIPALGVPGFLGLGGGTVTRIALFTGVFLAWFMYVWASGEARIEHEQSYRARALELMTLVGIPEPERRLDEYPHQLSGGMRQRAMIAMALSCRPQILIADEPTTALDVTIQAQILALMNDLRREFDSGIILITHDLGVVAEMADKVQVMYGGRTVESAEVHELFASPRHPYTWGLLESLPKLDERAKRLLPIKGVPPSLINLPSGCHFSPRCPFAEEICLHDYPELREVSPGHLSACHFSDKLHDRRAAVATAAAVVDPGVNHG